jgi:hypothetical protein
MRIDWRNKNRYTVAKGVISFQHHEEKKGDLLVVDIPKVSHFFFMEVLLWTRDDRAGLLCTSASE